MDSIYSILFNYLSGTATPQEAEIAEEWINGSEENSIRFQTFFKALQVTQHGNYVQPDSDKEWELFTKKKTLILKPFWSRPLIYVPTVIIIITFLCWFFLNKNIEYHSVNTRTFQSGQKVKDSSITGLDIFIDTGTITRMETHQPNQENLSIVNGSVFLKTTNQYIGSIFAGSSTILPDPLCRVWVFNDSVHNITKVEVHTGTLIIKVGEQKRKLKAGEAVKIENYQITVEPGNINKYSFATKVFDFRNIPLHEALKALEKAFRVAITQEPISLENCRITALFEDQSLEEILEILAYTLHFKYEFSNNEWNISSTPNSCK